ncbi:hypothetical protein SAMN05216345_10697 [Cupriavidus sp. YR651]|uniref:hypothetical protein n=1 Tax=Cupriavidus sp. YR651 TaxID=1855315 RepID=UPI0008880597|nr:hypothetical protein [Cupriavidus sp. YR651]SDD12462.1 hypothetical protein SAMN05216345_10697 [Cupriavidus sp. YR651]
MRQDAKARPLTAGEVELARRMFADSIDYTLVRVHSKNYVPWQGGNYIITPNGEIYLGRNLRHYTDFSAADLPAQGLFIHEMTHVWQYQQGIHVLLVGAIQQIRHFLISNQYAYTLEPGKTLASYNIEQQGDIVRDAFFGQQGMPAPYPASEYVATLGDISRSSDDNYVA